MPKLVTIFGGSGFVGRYVARRMAAQGWRVRVAVRRPNEALFVKPYGDVGQVEPELCNIRDDASVAAALRGADAAVNCVGILSETRKNNFQAVHVDGAERVARIAAEGSPVWCMFRRWARMRGQTATIPAPRPKAKPPCCAICQMPPFCARR
jgi:uncharacterized protein YbjT (DUF2867 family)